MPLPEELKEILAQLPELVEKHEKAHDLAHSAVEQLESLLPNRRELDEHKNPGMHLDKIIEGHDDIVTYGQAMVHAQDHITELINEAKANKWVRFKSLFNPNMRNNAHYADKMLSLGITYLVLLKIKRDIMERYEIDDRKEVKL